MGLRHRRIAKEDVAGSDAPGLENQAYFHKIPMITSALLWPFNPWAWKCYQCHVHLALINCDKSHENMSMKDKGEKTDTQTHEQTDRRT